MHRLLPLSCTILFALLHGLSAANAQFGVITSVDRSTYMYVEPDVLTANVYTYLDGSYSVPPGQTGHSTEFFVKHSWWDGALPIGSKTDYYTVNWGSQETVLFWATYNSGIYAPPTVEHRVEVGYYEYLPPGVAGPPNRYVTDQYSGTVWYRQ